MVTLWTITRGIITSGIIIPEIIISRVVIITPGTIAPGVISQGIVAPQVMWGNQPGDNGMGGSGFRDNDPLTILNLRAPDIQFLPSASVHSRCHQSKGAHPKPVHAFLT